MQSFTIEDIETLQDLSAKFSRYGLDLQFVDQHAAFFVIRTWNHWKDMCPIKPITTST